MILARQTGLKIIATTRDSEKFPWLHSMGADHVLLDQGEINAAVRDIVQEGVDHLIELVGTRTLMDSFAAVCIRGQLCLAGFLGGLAPLEHFHPLLQIPSGLQFTTFGSAFVFGQPGFELSGVPLQKIVTDIEEGRIRNIYVRPLPFEDIAEAHRLVETGEGKGKVVVVTASAR